MEYIKEIFGIYFNGRGKKNIRKQNQEYIQEMQEMRLLKVNDKIKYSQRPP